MARRRAILIAGPTASGKSALAIRLAEHVGGVVINADSMAVYRDLAILTGRPEPEDLARAPHRLYGHRDAAEPHSVALWLAEAASEIDAARRDGAVPIVVGGTGLFFKALTQGLSDIPAVPEEVRARVRHEAAGLPSNVLHERLARLDPLTASRVRPSDPQRVLRALEVFEATGRPLALLQGRRSAPHVPPGEGDGYVLTPDRETLRRAIDMRFDRMMERGALAEVKRLRDRWLDPTLPAMRALGVPPLLAHLDGTVAAADAVARSKAMTWGYARRQMTFARHQLADFVDLDTAAADAIIVGAALA